MVLDLDPANDAAILLAVQTVRSMQGVGAAALANKPVFVSGGLLQLGHVNLWAGAAGAGKSTLALAAAVAFTFGGKFCGELHKPQPLKIINGAEEKPKIFIVDSEGRGDHAYRRLLEDVVDLDLLPYEFDAAEQVRRAPCTGGLRFAQESFVNSLFLCA